MSENKILQWGETPWDDLSREELLREVQRMYAVIVELNSVVRMNRAYDAMRARMAPEDPEPPNPYWGRAGVGGKALEMARQVLEPLAEKYGESEIYRAFFRYANDLLFQKNGFEMIGCDWVICPECGVMYGSRMRELVSRPCSSEPLGKPGCTGKLCKLKWEDMRPK